MKTSSPESQLKPGDIFDTQTDRGEASDNVPSYLVLGFRDLAMRVAEIGGNNRDDLVVDSGDKPSALDIRKWRMRCEAAGTTDSYLKSKLSQLRRHLGNFRYANTIGSYTQLCVPTYSGGVDAVSYFNDIDSPLFCQSQYLFFDDGSVLPSMRLFDLGAMGVFSQERITRGENGRATTFDAGIDDKVNTTQLSAVSEFASVHNIIMFTDAYRNARLFSTNQREGIDRIEGFFRDDTGTHPRRFSRLQDAHNAVLEFRDSNKN